MSRVQMVGATHERVTHRASRAAVKAQRWGYLPKQKTPFGWPEIQMYLEVGAATVALILAWFFTWFYAG